MIENEFNILPGGWRNKDEPIILWETLEIHSACIVIQTLNKAYYTKSYYRMPFKVFVEITSKRSIDNLFTKIISLEESIKERDGMLVAYIRRRSNIHERYYCPCLSGI